MATTDRQSEVYFLLQMSQKVHCVIVGALSAVVVGIDTTPAINACRFVPVVSSQ